MKRTTTFLSWCSCLSISLLTALPAASARADSCPPAWTPGFPVAGIGGSVDALTVFDDVSGPALYAGGEFHAAGTVPAANIAKWNGTQWSALGSGMNDSVLALTVFDDGTGPALYAGGTFTTAGGVAANHVAKWDGAQWSALDSGVNDTVYALTVFNDGTGATLVAGGRFTTAGGVPVNRIAKWHPGAPGQWSALGSGIAGSSTYVRALTVHDDGTGPALVAGGEFTTAGGTSAKNIAKWNGTQWSALGSGVNNTVYALTVFDDGTGPALVAGGWFTSAGGVSANSVAKWQGSQWSALGSGMSSVYTLTDFDDGTGPALVAGGYFTTAGGVPANHIAKWDGAHWSALGNGIGNPEGYSDSIHALTVFDDGTGPSLVAGGYFTIAGGGPADSIAQWDGTQWSAMGSGLNAPVNALTVFDDGTGSALFVGGSFISAGDLAANAIAKWNPGTPGQWSALGSGLSGGSYNSTVVSALTVFDDGTGPALYAGGNFTSAGSVPANHIAKWDGTQWSALGSGMEGSYPYVAALAVIDDGSGLALYAGGGFTTAGGVPVNGIAKWNPGTPGQWSALASGVDGNVGALTVFDDGTGPALIVGGYFSAAGGVPASNIAKWNGSTWSALGSGVEHDVAALTVFDDGTGPALVAGGSFGALRTARTDPIAKWDGTQWSALGSGVGSGVAALTVFDDGTGPALIAGGWFTTAGGEPANRIARWDGTQWSTLGSGMSYNVYALTAFQDGTGPALYAGGDFATAGGIASGRLARWGCQTSPADHDGDGIPNGSDNCPEQYNVDQADCDTNGTGDACEPSATDCNANGIPDNCDTIAAGDFDADGDVDLVDYHNFTDCLAGPDATPAPPIPSCAAACLSAFDAEADGDIDLADFGAFQRQMSGPPG